MYCDGIVPDDVKHRAIGDIEGGASAPNRIDCQRRRQRGYEAAKKTKGIKRHILVDTLGLLLAVCVTPADVPEREGARRLSAPALVLFRWLRCLWADQGYGGEELANWVAAHRKTGTLRLEVVPRLQDQRGFQVLRKRWIVERTFGWFMK
ncbi:MAG TPA: transposase, partial [Verrucomicrobiae bacterium]|nr:transposase [Verrucomicrobiae bacterium]